MTHNALLTLWPLASLTLALTLGRVIHLRDGELPDAEARPMP